MILFVFPLIYFAYAFLFSLPDPEPVPKALAEIHCKLIFYPHLASHRLATVILFSPLLFISVILSVLSGLSARYRLQRNFQFSSPTMFLLGRKILFLSVLVLVAYIFLPVHISNLILLVSAALAYVGLYAAAKHFPFVW